MPRTDAVKDPKTKKKISIYNALRKGDLDTLKKVYEIKEGDLTLFNQSHGGIYPYDWAMRKGYYKLIEWFVSIGVKPTFDCDSFLKIYSDDLKHDFRSLDQLLTIPNINLLYVCSKALTPTKFRKEQFIKIMNHSNTRLLYNKYNYGYIEEDEKDDHHYYPNNINEIGFFWTALMNIDEDVFQILIEFGYEFNSLKILKAFSNISYYTHDRVPFKKVMLEALFTKVKSKELTDEENIIFDQSMYKLLYSNFNLSTKLKILIKLYGDKYDFNRKMKAILSNCYNNYCLNINYSLIEEAVHKNDLVSLKLMLKCNGGVIKSNKLFLTLFNKLQFLFYDTDFVNMFNFLNNNYKELLFCEDDENWNFNYSTDKYKYKYNFSPWFSLEFQSFIKAIIENCKNEKFLQMITYIYTFRVNDKDREEILKFSFTNITKEVNYIEEHILQQQDLIIKKYKSIINKFNDFLGKFPFDKNQAIVKREYEYSYHSNIYKRILNYIKFYQICGYTFSESFMTNPRFEEIEKYEAYIKEILSMREKYEAYITPLKL